jgi:uncharacterized protein
MPDDYFSAFEKHQYMNLVTFRKSGAAVKTPVWFVKEATRLVMYTMPITGKFKRIRNNPRVTVAPSNGRGNPLGGAIEGYARIIQGEEAERAEQSMQRKYGMMYKVMGWLTRLRTGNVARVLIEITPP